MRAASARLPRLVFHDEHVAVIDKPSGVLSAPTPEGDRGNHHLTEAGRHLRVEKRLHVAAGERHFGSACGQASGGRSAKRTGRTRDRRTRGTGRTRDTRRTLRAHRAGRTLGTLRTDRTRRARGAR